MANIYRVRTVFGGLEGSPYLSTQYWGPSNIGTEIEKAQRFANATGVFWAAVDNELHFNLTWATEAEVAVIDTTTGDQTAALITTTSSGAGDETGSQMAHSTQGLVRWTTGDFIAGRRIRGRTFIPGQAQSKSTSDGKPNSTMKTAVNAAAAAMIATTNAAPVIWSRKNGVAANIGAGAMWDQYAVLRSRRD